MEKPARSRPYVVELNPHLDYLSGIVRDIGWHFRSEQNKDPFLDFVYSQLPSSLVHRGSDRCVFRFDLEGGKHHRGATYSYGKSGVLRLCEVLLRSRPHEEQVGFLDFPEGSAPPLDELTPGGLLEAIRLLAIHRVLSA